MIGSRKTSDGFLARTKYLSTLSGRQTSFTHISGWNFEEGGEWATATVPEVSMYPGEYDSAETRLFLRVSYLICWVLNSLELRG